MSLSDFENKDSKKLSAISFEVATANQEVRTMVIMVAFFMVKVPTLFLFMGLCSY